MAAGRMRRRFDARALGRLRPGDMNKTEAAFDRRLRELALVGEILWHSFEGIKLKLAPNTHLTIDFAVLPASGVLEMIDVKGSMAMIEEDAKAKMKIAAAKFPFVFKYATPRPKRDGGGWEIIEI